MRCILFFLLFAASVLPLSLPAQPDKLLILQDTTFASVIPNFNKLATERDRLRQQEENLSKQISQLRADIANNERIAQEQRTRYLEELMRHCGDTALAENQVLDPIARIGGRYIAAKEAYTRDNATLTTRLEELSRTSAEKEQYQTSINTIVKWIPIAARNHLGGYKNLNIEGTPYLVYIADLTTEQIQLHFVDTTSGRPIGNLQSLLAIEKGATMATNAGMFTPRQVPQGLYISDDVEKGKYPVDLSDPNDDNFYLMPNGVFAVDTNGFPIVMETKAFVEEFGRQVQPAIQLATQSGPMLVINGNIHPSFTEGSQNLNIRSGVGIMDSNKVVFAISMQPVNFYDFASLFQEVFRCDNALYLDGAISEMFVKGLHERPFNRRFGPMLTITPKTSE